MAEEEIIEQIADVEEKPSGNFVAIFGKIFLSIIAIVVQIYFGFQIVEGNYESINEKLASFASSESVYHPIENIIVNPSGADGKRYLLMSLALELDDAGTVAMIEKHNIKITDRINTILSVKTVEELNDLNQRAAIKQELGIAINQIIDKNSVQNLFFTKYVMQ